MITTQHLVSSIRRQYHPPSGFVDILLEKFEGVDIPESVTPNPYGTFSHFEELEDPEDKDHKILKNGLTRVSGTCRELAHQRVGTRTRSR